MTTELNADFAAKLKPLFTASRSQVVVEGQSST
jgi:hypothetical protein